MVLKGADTKFSFSPYFGVDGLTAVRPWAQNTGNAWAKPSYFFSGYLYQPGMVFWARCGARKIGIMKLIIAVKFWC